MPDPPDAVDPDHWAQDVAFPALLRAAQATYRTAIRANLAAGGFDDLPRNGAFVLGAIARTGAPLSEVIADLGRSKQATGQLVDTLVARGYLDRAVDPDDRRRLTVSLTERGTAAAGSVRAAVDGLDAELAQQVGAAAVAQMRATLGALVDSRAEG
jgi:DNA-binding MarR family transcriptional regulator